ncbi:hypothetical protein NQ315_003281 [Exocentrus adspersus]|uniref:Uncharacterized protein n=1 Tax=Exocentrus adspersus TaxID=1586481 RepID=A0AAV8VCL5_9CUCU|nr:hypothetical protein NQ315_003281 [Exocentrus adspersus]
MVAYRMGRDGSRQLSGLSKNKINPCLRLWRCLGVLSQVASSGGGTHGNFKEREGRSIGMFRPQGALPWTGTEPIIGMKRE